VLNTASLADCYGSIRRQVDLVRRDAGGLEAVCWFIGMPSGAPALSAAMPNVW
jgi:hypothetical protein